MLHTNHKQTHFQTIYTDNIYFFNIKYIALKSHLRVMMKIRKSRTYYIACDISHK